MSKRYRIHPDDTWHDATEDTFPRGNFDVTVEVRDVLEVNGTVWHSGAWRVKSPRHKTRVFIGESAWSSAERLAWDWWNERRYAS